jgi:hypothetical protein
MATHTLEQVQIAIEKMEKVAKKLDILKLDLIKKQ